MAEELAFGLNAEVPAEAKVCWGARWIFPDDHVHDRQDFKGMNTPEGQKLKSWLIELGAFNKARDEARRLAKTTMRQDEEKVYVLYEDKTGVVKANPRSSYGYLYVCAYLKEVSES